MPPTCSLFSHPCSPSHPPLPEGSQQQCPQPSQLGTPGPLSGRTLAGHPKFPGPPLETNYKAPQIFHHNYPSSVLLKVGLPAPAVGLPLKSPERSAQQMSPPQPGSPAPPLLQRTPEPTSTIPSPPRVPPNSPKPRAPVGPFPRPTEPQTSGSPCPGLSLGPPEARLSSSPLSRVPPQPRTPALGISPAPNAGVHPPPVVPRPLVPRSFQRRAVGSPDPQTVSPTSGAGRPRPKARPRPRLRAPRPPPRALSQCPSGPE